MRNWIGRAIFWLATVAGFGPSLLRFLQWTFNLVGGVDLVVERVRDPGWIGNVVNWCGDLLTYLLNMPPWSYPLMIIAGVIVLFLDRRFVAAKTASPGVEPVDLVADEARKEPPTAIAVEVTSVYGTVGDLVSLSAIRVTNAGDSPLSGCIVKAESFRAIYQPDASSVITKKMDGIPNPMVLRTEGQMRNKRGGGFNLRVGESKNVGVLWRNKSGKGPRMLVAEDGTHYPVSNSFEVTVGVYGNAAPVRKRLSIKIGDSVETRVLQDADGPLVAR